MNEEQWVQMEPEDQWGMFDAMHQAFHDMQHDSAAAEGNAGTLIQCLYAIADTLSDGNKLGKRKAAIDGAVLSARVIATKALMAMPNSLNTSAWVAENLAFDDIAAQLENDPEFNRDAE